MPRIWLNHVCFGAKKCTKIKPIPPFWRWDVSDLKQDPRPKMVKGARKNSRPFIDVFVCHLNSQRSTRCCPPCPQPMEKMVIIPWLLRSTHLLVGFPQLRELHPPRWFHYWTQKQNPAHWKQEKQTRNTINMKTKKHHNKCGGKSLSFTKPFLLPCLFSNIGGKALGANGVGLRKGSVLAISSSRVSARTTPTQTGWWSRKECSIRNRFHGRNGNLMYI